MKKQFVVLVVTLLVLALAIGGCASTPPPATATSPAPTASTAPAANPAPTAAPSTAPAAASPSAAQKTWSIKYAHEDPPNSLLSQNVHIPFAEAIEKATNGRVKVTIYPAETLAKSANAYTAVSTGITDIAHVVIALLPGQFPMTESIMLPFIPYGTGENAAGVLNDLYAKFPDFQKEWKDVKVLEFSTTSPYWLLTRKQVKTMEDLKGMKIRVLGPHTAMAQALGAIPISVPMPDVYLNLQKGVLDGIALPYEAYGSYKFFEVAKYGITNLAMGVIPFCTPMNMETWNSFPKDIQDQIMSVSGKTRGMAQSKAGFDSVEVAARDMAKKGNYEFIEYKLPADELTRWAATGGKPVQDKWVAGMEAKGLAGKAIYEELNKLVAQANPAK
jgi:TRAP-type transport system periplasmic protein